MFGQSKTHPTGIKHGTVTVVPSKQGSGYEVTTFRVDGSYSDGRHPDCVSFSLNLIDDLSRRDFTINAIACAENGELIDPYGGCDDIQKGIIRCVGDARQRFSEDSLRILRALRFMARYGFEVEKDTADAMFSLAGRMKVLSRERIGKEFCGIVTGRYAAKTISKFRRILFYVVPELKSMDGCSQNNPYHYGTVFEHTLDALEYANTSERFPAEWADDFVKIALLFHDIGKPLVKSTDANNQDHFYAHEVKSAAIAYDVLTRLRCSNKLRDTVVELVRNHTLEATPTPCRVRRVLNRLDVIQVRRILKMTECDVMAHTDIARARLEKAVTFRLVLDEVLSKNEAFSLKQLAVDGKDLIDLGMKPGPEVGKVLEFLLAEVMNGAENNKEKLLKRIQFK